MQLLTRLSWTSVQTQSRHPTVQGQALSSIQVHVPQLRLGTNILHLVKILKDYWPPEFDLSQERTVYSHLPQCHFSQLGS